MGFYYDVMHKENTSFNILFVSALAAFTPVDLSDLKKRNTQDSKKS